MIASAKAVDAGVIDGLSDQVEHLRMLDRQVGGPAVAAPTRALVRSMRDMMNHTVLPEARERLATTLADVAALAAWQALNCGETSAAWELFNVGKAAGLESSSTAHHVFPMAEQAYALLDLGMATDAVELLRAAQRAARSHVPALMSSWLYAAEAEACAAADDAAATHRALERASAVMPSETDSHELPFLSLSDEHLTRWRGHSLSRIGDTQATAELLDALRRLDPTFVRARGALECDLAYALAAAGEDRAAQPHLDRARQLAQQTGSIRVLRRADQVQLAA
jgi:tetratricopeptide (TPR) repeat protein